MVSENEGIEVHLYLILHFFGQWKLQASLTFHAFLSIENFVKGQYQHWHST